MNLSQDEARAARIQKYKEERRKQLTARTATLFSANVTERRTRKAAGRAQSDDTGDHLKSSSELNLNAVINPMPIRTTRTSRLRAAANHSDTSPSPRKSNRSSSVQSLLDDAKKTPKCSKIIERDKQRSVLHKRQSSENVNLKSPSGTYNSDKENGAIKTKTKHSTTKIILEKDTSNFLENSDNAKIVIDKTVSKLEEKKKKNSLIQNELLNSNCEENVPLCLEEEKIFNDILADYSDTLEKKKIEDLFDNLVVDDENVQCKLEIEDINDVNIMNGNVGLKNSLKSNIPMRESIVEMNNAVNSVKLEDSDLVPKVKEDVGSLLGAVCVRKVERFSELLSNLCSPCEADVLFEDILVENGIDGDGNLRNAPPECTPPCRRAPPSSRTTSTPMHTQTKNSNIVTPSAGTVAKTRSRRPFESPHSKTENSLASSRVSPKYAFNQSLGNNSSPTKSQKSNVVSLSKPNERRRSSETGTKPSCIPLSKKSADKKRTSLSPLKQESAKDTVSKSKLETSRSNCPIKPPEQLKKDSENNRDDKKNKSHKESESVSEKYHNTKKRLTSLENNSSKNSNGHSSKNVLKYNTELNSKSNAISSDLEDNKATKMLSTLPETVRPHTSNSRLSQEMDSLAALTKQTLDRVNKLSNNLNINKLTLDSPEQPLDSLYRSASEQKESNHNINYGSKQDKPVTNRGVTERLRDIDTAAQRLIDFEKQSAMFSDLNDISSQNRRLDASSMSCHTPVSILKRKSVHEDNVLSNASNHAIASPPVTFSPSVIEPRSCRSDRQRQGILKKRRSLDESQVARRRSCSPEVSFADDGSIDSNKPILKNRRSSLEDVIRNRSPDGQIQGILKRKMSREEDYTNEDISNGSPEPHSILKRKSNSSSSSSTTSSHVSIAQAVLLAAAGGAEIVDDDKDIVRPILKKKSFSEERPCLDIMPSDTPKPILKKKSTDHDDHDFDLPKKPILKSSKKLSGDEGHASSFDLSEDDRSSRRPSLLRSRTSDHSGSECEAAVKPILKQRGSSLSRERSQSPRPRLSFCADSDANISVTNTSCDANDLSVAGPRRIVNITPDTEESYPCAVLRRRNLRPKTNPRSKSLVCDVNDELLCILNNRRLKVEENCVNGHCEPWELNNRGEAIGDDSKPKEFPSIAARIKSMEQALTGDSLSKNQPSTSRCKPRDKERFKTQPITIDEMRSAASSLDPGQPSFQAFGIAACSFPSRPVESGVAPPIGASPGYLESDPFVDFVNCLDSPPFGTSSFSVKSPVINGLSETTSGAKDNDSYGEATFLDFENVVPSVERKQSTLDEIEQEVNKVRVALDEDSRALDEDEKHQAEAENWSLNVSYDSGVYNRASSRDSGPHSGKLSHSKKVLHQC
ncbi:unnamed protein product [Diatraea saccharalis]|uniref:Uncharacterized protein n=1 Tax=Diatraea saccharalis TaxID=40085 RepID=A0A9P0C8Y7_9NEOP|nr:unnamed protein product [Diatraea saccharalis]